MISESASGAYVRVDLEFVAEGLVIEEDPGIPVLPIPVMFELGHTLHYAIEFRVTYKTDECCSRLWRHMAVR